MGSFKGGGAILALAIFLKSQELTEMNRSKYDKKMQNQARMLMGCTHL